MDQLRDNHWSLIAAHLSNDERLPSSINEKKMFITSYHNSGSAKQIVKTTMIKHTHEYIHMTSELVLTIPMTCATTN